MGHDNSLNPSATTANSRPQMPSLSASAARGMNRTPLTPKIASASRSSQSQTPNLATIAATAATATRNTTATATATTPLSRRTQQRPISTISTSASPSRTKYDDDQSIISTTAISPHLSSNVTPRSASRQNRVDSANGTPNGTPNYDRSENWNAKPGFSLSNSLNQGDCSKKPIVTFTAVSPEQRAPSRQDVTNSRGSKFFHASEVKTKPPSKNSRNSAFFYANGDDIAPTSASSSASPLPPLSPVPNQSQENASSKFMYANGTPEVPPMQPTTLSRGSSSTVGTSSKGYAVGSTVGSQRPALTNKPLHPSSHRNSTGAQGTTLNANATAASQIRVSPPPQLGPSPPGLRRASLATPQSRTHSRSTSLVKEESTSEALRPLASPITSFFPPVNVPSTQPPPLTLASIIQAAEEFSEQDNDTPPEDQSALQSPTKSTVSSADPVTELIASARRERRVQDLQIRNASLEAINRTLERQLRKQSAELRRFRRLSRTSHLSLASTTMSSRVPSGTIPEVESESLGLFDLGAEDQSMIEDLQKELQEELSDTDSASDLSPSVQAARDAKHRQQDEQRLTVDLSKHQQILLDSQKINKSIKKCIDWTEELIKEGRKALEYNIQISDVQLGGRVLDPLDEDEHGHTGLLLTDETVALDAESIVESIIESVVESVEESVEEPTEELIEELIEEPSGTLMTWGVEPQDRDSGIEMLKDGG
ncbi:hypothetical protein F4861DRAFT_339701 [Xylaria intraflava]|nr:hypothetical protein F4861DRAFT_339701 [Xylaria intraflava]